MNTLHLHRDYTTPQVTHGILKLVDPAGKILFECFSLELPWRNNEVERSCIPTGTYTLLHRTSPRFGKHLHVTNVPGRSFILIHPANYVSQLRGCIAPGLFRRDINGDDILDVGSSRAAMSRLLELVNDRDKLIIS